MISSILHSASQVSLLAGALSVFVSFSLVWLTLRRRMKNDSIEEKRILSASAQSLGSNSIHLVSNHWPIILVIITGLSLATNLYQIHREYAAAVYTDHNVSVDKVIDKYHWSVHSAKRGHYRTDFCRTAHNEAVLDEVNGQAGYTLETLRWTYIGDCWNVSDESDRSGPLGFWWIKDASGWALKETKQ